MARLIDAMQTVIKMSSRITSLIQMGANPTHVYNEVLQVVEDAPTVDAVEVVRCKNCKHYNEGFCVGYHAHHDTMPDDFCSYGERKDCVSDG